METFVFFKIVAIVTVLFVHSLESSVVTTSYKQVDPEAYMDAGQIIQFHGYPLEQHYVETADGFILNAQRIPYGRKNVAMGVKREPVLLQHGLLAGSDSFVLNIPSKSIGFMLADEGYDVWLSNSRGNLYSMKHRKFNTSQNEFWDWSWQQMGQFDLPAMINYVLNTTGSSQLFYIGHSQGTLIAFAQFSVDHELAQKVKLFIALGPVATVKHVKGLTAFAAPFLSEHLDLVYALFGHQSFLMNSTVRENIVTKFCDAPITSIACSDFSALIMGPDSKNVNLTRVPVYQAHATEGTSVRNMIHYAQEWKSGKFQMYDFGSPLENMKHYNQTTPPMYDPREMMVPTALFSATDDWLADPEDVSFLLDRLPNIVKQKEIPTWNHVDFILGMNAPTVLYPDILSLFKQY